MGYAFHHTLLLFVISVAISSADMLENPDFEIPPANFIANGTFLFTDIPGWSVNGTVWYTAWGGGHAVQLGPNGKLNQTVFPRTTDVNFVYYLGFTVAAQNQNCANNLTALNVTIRDNWGFSTSRVIQMLKNSSRDLWERHALCVDSISRAKSVNIELQSVATNSCWPIIDAFAVSRNPVTGTTQVDFPKNPDFEVGPAFVNNLPNGIILNNEPNRAYSPLHPWSILGTIRYIDSGHFKVPQGRAALELLSISDELSGIQQFFYNMPKPISSTYTLKFSLGDANDSCVGDLMISVLVETSAANFVVHNSVYNFTVHSSGIGSAVKHSITFKVEPLSSYVLTTSIGFNSSKEMRSTDGLLCGPVVDDVSLDYIFSVNGSSSGVLVVNLFIVFLMHLVLGLYLN